MVSKGEKKDFSPYIWFFLFIFLLFSEETKFEKNVKHTLDINT